MPHEHNGQWVRKAVARYEQPLLRYAVGLLGDASGGQDVVQEAFLRLCRQNPDHVQPRLEAWLYTVCRNHAIDICRKRKRMTPLSDLQPAAPQTESSLEQAEAHAQVNEALAQLPANQREVIRLKFQHNMKYKQIAQITGLSATNVGYLIHTALKTLRQQLTA